jgi:hypothetical protein
MPKGIQFTITAVDKATATMNRINRDIAKMVRPYEMLAKSAKRFADSSGLTKVSKNLGDVAKQADKAARSITKMAAPLLAIVGGGTIAGLSQMVTEWEKIGAKTERTSRMLGITAQQLTQMRSAANLMGVSSETMTAGFQSLQDTLQDARWGRNQGAFATLQALGITLKTTKNGAIDTKAAMYDLADRMQRIQQRDPAAARNLARSLGVEQLLPVLVKGRAGMQAYEAEARRLRGDFTPDMAQRADAFAQSLSGMKAAADGLQATIADKLAPVLQPLIEKWTNWLAANRGEIGEKIGAVVQRIADALSRIDPDKFLDGLMRAINLALVFAGALVKLIDKLGGFKAVMAGVALYMGGGFIASLLSAGVGIASLGLRVAMLARAWMGAGGAAAAATEAITGAGAAAETAGAAAGAGAAGAAAAGRGILARVAGGLLRFVNPATVGAYLGLHSEALNTGEDEQLKRIRAAEAATGGTWPGSPAAPAGAGGTSASVAQWAQRLNFAGLEKQYGLPAGLLAGVAQVESKGNAGIMSPAGAAGLFQFMPGTAREYGINPLNPAQSANAAARKLGGLYRRYGGNLTAALSAYNWGEGNLERRGMANAPLETQLYAPKVLAAMGGAPADSGAAMPPLNAPAPQMAATAPPVVHVSTQVHVERDGRTSVRTETPSGLHVAYPMAGDAV